MSRLLQWVLAFVAWVVSLFRRGRSAPALPAPEPPRPTDGRLRAVLVDEQPKELSPGECYLVGEGRFRWFAVFVCPCGCQDGVVLNLLTEMRPCWRVDVHEDEVVTFHPSINRQVGCRSHFTVRLGSVTWCRSSAPR